MNKKSTKILLAVAAVAVLALVLWFILGRGGAKDAGRITVTVQDASNKVIAEKVIGYQEDAKLADLVAANFANVTYDNGMLMTSESLTTLADWSSFICIYQNGKASDVGIMEMTFADGDKIDFIDTPLK